MARKVLTIVALVVAAASVAACGSNEIDEGLPPRAQQAAQLFSDNCGMCHTFDVVGSEGSATNVNDRERVDGPNFNERQEDVEGVLYAIRNGGFSGAIMPENILTGEEARLVAEFVAEYAGREAPELAE